MTSKSLEDQLLKKLTFLIKEYGFLSDDEIIHYVGEIMEEFPEEELIQKIKNELERRNIAIEVDDGIKVSENFNTEPATSFQPKQEKIESASIIRGYIQLKDKKYLDFSSLRDELFKLEGKWMQNNEIILGIFGTIEASTIVCTDSLFAFSLKTHNSTATVTVQPFSFTISSTWTLLDKTLFQDPRYLNVPSVEYQDMLRVPVIAEGFKAFNVLKTLLDSIYGDNFKIHITEVEYPILANQKF